jgi:hypothetical protein
MISQLANVSCFLLRFCRRYCLCCFCVPRYGRI